MSDSRKKYLIVGAGPVGTKLALGLKEKFQDNADIEIVEKRLQPGNRQEVLLLNKDSLNKLPSDVHEYLFNPDSEKKAKAFLSDSIYHGKYQQIVKETHTIVKINDLENSLCEAVNNRKIPITRGFEFITADSGTAKFKNTDTNEIIEKKYDELILAIGLSGALSHSQTEKTIFETPRLLHSFPVIIARYTGNFHDFNPIEQPTSILCFTQDRLAFFFVTPNSFSTCISIPASEGDKLTNAEEQMKFVNETTKAIPKELQYLLEKIDLSKPEIIKSVPAIATLTPKILDVEHHAFFAGDLLSTFPYVWGSETNVAYNSVLPLLEDLFLKLQNCNADERHQYLKDYEEAVKKAITSNEYFLRVLHYGETIHLGSITSSMQYSFPGWDQLAKAEPYSKEYRNILTPLHELNTPLGKVSCNEKEAHSSVNAGWMHPNGQNQQRSIFASISTNTSANKSVLSENVVNDSPAAGYSLRKSQNN